MGKGSFAAQLRKKKAKENKENNNSRDFENKLVKETNTQLNRVVANSGD